MAYPDGMNQLLELLARAKKEVENATDALANWFSKNCIMYKKTKWKWDSILCDNSCRNKDCQCNWQHQEYSGDWDDSFDDLFMMQKEVN